MSHSTLQLKAAAGARLKKRWPMLACALLLAICAMPLPATSEQVPLLPLHYTPVIVLPIADVVAVLSGNFGVALLATLPAQLCFLLTPMLVAIHPHALWARVVRCALVLMLLTIWAAPVEAAVAAKLHPRFAHDQIGIGFYIYGVAHTLAFIACLGDPLKGRKASRKVGFPVKLLATAPQSPSPTGREI